jgi:hypothetical protein
MSDSRHPDDSIAIPDVLCKDCFWSTVAYLRLQPKSDQMSILVILVKLAYLSEHQDFHRLIESRLSEAREADRRT